MDRESRADQADERCLARHFRQRPGGNPAPSPGDEGHGGEGAEQHQHQRQVRGAGQIGGAAEQQQRCHPAGAEQLRRQHAVQVARAAQDVQQPEQHRQQNECACDQ
jgi:hypothetical protein